MENPYQSTDSGQNPAADPAKNKKPAQVTVFGILHILVALIGFGGIIATKIFSPNQKKAVLDAFQLDPEAPVTFSQEGLEALDRALSYNLYFEIAGAVLATMLLTSGLAMLLNARWGIKLSNSYSLLSILLKGITIALTVAILIPAYQSFCEGISGGDPALVKTMCLTFQYSGLLGAIITVIYPLAALIFLTRARVKEFQRSL